MLAKAEGMGDAANRPLWGCSGKCAKVSLSGFRKLQEGGATGIRETSLDMSLARPSIDDPIPLYEFSRRSGEAPGFTGAARRPHMAAK